MIISGDVMESTEAGATFSMDDAVSAYQQRRSGCESSSDMAVEGHIGAEGIVYSL